MSSVAVLRAPHGRFAPGQSGNPAGRPKGARNKATSLIEAITEGEAQAVVRKALDLALAGNVRLLKLFLELLIAKPRANPVELDIEPERASDPWRC